MHAHDVLRDLAVARLEPATEVAMQGWRAVPLLVASKAMGDV